MQPQQQGPAAAAAADAPLLHLPVTLLQAVLQQLTLRDAAKLARACSAARAAVAAALDRIIAEVHSDGARDSLLLYLEHHGQHVSRLDVRIATPLQFTSLPASCSRLQALSLMSGYAEFQLSGPGVLSTATSALTSLRLLGRSSAADTTQGVAAAVARLTQLRELQCAWSVYDGPLPGSMLAPLQELTALTLALVDCFDNHLQPATLQHDLRALSSLRQLSLDGLCATADMGACLTVLRHLPALTALELKDVRNANLTGLGRSLQRLELTGCVGVTPHALEGCGGLRALHVMDSSISGAMAGSAAWLQSLRQHCTRLTCLRIRRTLDMRVTPMARYGCLTACSAGSLEALDLSGCMIPASAWRPLFAAVGRGGLPRLRELGLFFSSCNLGDDADGAGVQRPGLQALARCCPALETLKLVGWLRLGTPGSLAPLTALTLLSDLTINDHSAIFNLRLQGRKDMARQLGEFELQRRPPATLNELLEGDTTTSSVAVDGVA